MQTLLEQESQFFHRRLWSDKGPVIGLLQIEQVSL